MLSDYDALVGQFEDIVIFDLDGVLACNKHRLHHVHDNRDNPDWEAFYKNLELDPRLPWCSFAELIKRTTDYGVVIVTNRPEEFRARTEWWLKSSGLQIDMLLMRVGGYSHSKRYHLQRLRRRHNIVLALDDDPEHIDMYKFEGVPTLYVPSGYYDGGRVPDKAIIGG